MNIFDIRKAGLVPTPFGSFQSLDLGLMIWALAYSIAPDFGLSDAMRGLILGAPPLGFALFRLVVGAYAARSRRPSSLFGTALTDRDTWWFSLFNSVALGGFIGLALFLNGFFRMQYGLGATNAGYLASACIAAGFFARPAGVYLADRFGGASVLWLAYVAVGVLMISMAGLPSLVFGSILMFLVMGLLGLANGAVMQIVPRRFSAEDGVVSGLVGASGAIAGLFLTILLGLLKQRTGSFGDGFLVFGCVGGFGAALALTHASRAWREGTAPGCESEYELVGHGIREEAEAVA